MKTRQKLWNLISLKRSTNLFFRVICPSTSDLQQCTLRKLNQCVCITILWSSIQTSSNIFEHFTCKIIKQNLFESYFICKENYSNENRMAQRKWVSLSFYITILYRWYLIKCYIIIRTLVAENGIYTLIRQITYVQIALAN